MKPICKYDTLNYITVHDILDFVLQRNTRIQHPRTFGRLLLLSQYAILLAKVDGEIKLLRTHRKAPMSQCELKGLMDHLENDFLKEVYYKQDRMKHCIDEDKVMKELRRRDVVRIALDIDEKELNGLLGKFMSPPECPEEPKEEEIQEQLKAEVKGKWESQRSEKKKELLAQMEEEKKLKKKKDRLTEEIIEQRLKEEFQNPPEPTMEEIQREIVKRKLQHTVSTRKLSNHEEIQKIIIRERKRRAQELRKTQPNILMLRHQSFLDPVQKGAYKQYKVHNTEDLSDFRSLSRRLQKTYQIAGIGDKGVLKHATNNIKLMRDEKPVTNRLEWRSY